MKKKSLFSVNEIAEIAMLVAFAILLDQDFFKITLFANGGSIGLTMVPLFILAYRHGPLKSFIAIGLIYGFATCALDNHGFASYPFDYLLAYGSLSVAGFFGKKAFVDPEGKTPDVARRIHWTNWLWISVSLLLGCTLRWLFHTLSGVIYWETPFFDSMIYSVWYVWPSAVLVFIAVAALYKPILFVNKRYPVRPL